MPYGEFMAEKTDKGMPVKIINTSLDSDIPQLYFNGFTNATGSGDFLLILQRNGRPVATLNTSYTVAKTLAESLTKMVARFENTTGNRIMTTHEVEAALGQDDEKGSNAQ